MRTVRGERRVLQRAGQGTMHGCWESTVKPMEKQNPIVDQDPYKSSGILSFPIGILSETLKHSTPIHLSIRPSITSIHSYFHPLIHPLSHPSVHLSVRPTTSCSFNKHSSRACAVPQTLLGSYRLIRCTPPSRGLPFSGQDKTATDLFSYLFP